MKQNKDELFNIKSNSPLFSTLLGISGALLCADTLACGVVLSVFVLIISVCLSAFRNVVSKKLNEVYTFWSIIMLGAVVSFPLSLAIGTMLSEEKAVLFAVVGVTVGYAAAKSEGAELLVDEIKNSLFFSLMYSVSVVIFSFVRELLAKGSILGVKLFGGIEFFGTFYGAIFIFVVVAVIYKAVSSLLTKEREAE